MQYTARKEENMKYNDFYNNQFNNVNYIPYTPNKDIQEALKEAQNNK